MQFRQTLRQGHDRLIPQVAASTFTQGMDVTFVTTTNKDDEARELLRAFGMPFRDK